jgi:hypothetical protein
MVDNIKLTAARLAHHVAKRSADYDRTFDEVYEEALQIIEATYQIER